MKIVIIGNGAAGITTASEIRKSSAEHEIIMVSDEPYYHYSRPRVIEYLAGKAGIDAITIRKKEWYEQNNIKLLLNTKAESIDASGKTILLSNGEKTGYDRLVIAAGAYSFVPPVKGSDNKGVFTLRTIQDADKIIEYSKDKKDAAVIGGGLLGIEAAMSLATRGLDVTVIEFFDRLLPRQLDEKGAATLQTILEGKGLKFLLPRKTRDITGNGKLKITFEQGEPVETGMILFSAGIRCRLDIIKGTGIKADKGIQVNNRMETDVEGIYAVGDIAEHNGRVYGIWPACREQGIACASGITGENGVYNGTVMATKLKIAGIELASAGSIEAKDGEEEKINAGEGYYKKFVVKDGRLTGAILLGDTKAYSKIQKYIKSGETISGEIDGLLK